MKNPGFFHENFRTIRAVCLFCFGFLVLQAHACVLLFLEGSSINSGLQKWQGDQSATVVLIRDRDKGDTRGSPGNSLYFAIREHGKFWKTYPCYWGEKISKLHTPTDGDDDHCCNLLIIVVLIVSSSSSLATRSCLAKAVIWSSNNLSPALALRALVIYKNGNNCTYLAGLC